MIARDLEWAFGPTSLVLSITWLLISTDPFMQVSIYKNGNVEEYKDFKVEICRNTGYIEVPCRNRE